MPVNGAEGDVLDELGHSSSIYTQQSQYKFLNRFGVVEDDCTVQHRPLGRQLGHRIDAAGIIYNQESTLGTTKSAYFSPLTISDGQKSHKHTGQSALAKINL